MRFFSQLFLLGLAAEATVASTWFSKAGMLQPQFSPERFTASRLYRGAFDRLREGLSLE